MVAIKAGHSADMEEAKATLVTIKEKYNSLLEQHTLVKQYLHKAATSGILTYLDLYKD